MQISSIFCLTLAAAASAIPTQVSKIIGNVKRQAPVESSIWGNSITGSPEYYDNNWANVTLPFPISFYGVNYSNLWVSINGILSPGPEQIQYPDTSSAIQNHIPVDSIAVGAGQERPDLPWVPEKALFALWQDLFVENAPIALHAVWTTTSGSAPSRIITFSWKVSSEGVVGGQIVEPEFSVSFREARPYIARIEYTDVADKGINAVIGIQSSFSTGVEWSYKTEALFNGDILAVNLDTQTFNIS
ncbi:hypothetical protein TWF506_008003 [Arthrobotrys conoides]|uniref:Uncharacterized protein n=1 Tax=Arthrobotrys conoides TaxID=74498 RepID=A0AAN8NV57_9PEZI